MRETTMKHNTWSIVTAVGITLVLAGCSAKSPTAPKPTPQPTGYTITLTATPNPADPAEDVVVVAQVTSGSGNAPDGTPVTFDTNFGAFVDSGLAVTEEIRTTVGGRASATLRAPLDPSDPQGKLRQKGSAAVLARVQGTSASTQRTVSFQTAPPPTPGQLYVTTVTPTKGGVEGGDRVILTGGGFLQPLTVRFVVAGQPFPADVNFVSTDGSTMTVTTPRVASTPPYQTDQAADIAVTSGANTYTLPGGGSSGFTYLAQATTPQIYTLTPNAGPFEGGTRVVITGIGFMYPVQVLFGDRLAQVTSSNYTEVDCIAPSITPSGPNATTTVNVTVTNTLNGKTSNQAPYRYGETMFISGMTPNEGSADAPTSVTIFGQGFVAPVSVVAVAGGAQFSWTVTSVSGTEIVATALPIPDSARSCADLVAVITVTNLDSNTKFTATQPFTYRAVRPLITSVDIDTAGNNTVQQYLPGTCNTTWSSHTVTVHGSGFQTSGGVSAMTVAFTGLGTFVPTTFVDANTITFRLPDLTGIALNQVSCNDGGGPGRRDVATPVGMTIHNLRNSCENTLDGAIVINPCVTSCQVLPAPTITSVLPNTGSIAGGDSVIITGTNFVNSGLSATFAGASASGVSFIDATHVAATTPGHTPAGPVSVTVFCGGQSGTLASGFTYTATMDMTIVGTGDVAANPVPFVGSSPCSSGTCNWTFNASVVTLTPSTTGAFSGWSGASCGCTGTTSPCTVTMSQNRSCTATFTP